MNSTDSAPSGSQSSTKTTIHSPGNLSSEETPKLTLHTGLGRMLFTGRKAEPGKHEIVGLVRFASQVLYIWNGASQDDPYADWWLIKVDKALGLSNAELHVTLRQIQSLFTEKSNLSLPIGISKNPLEVPLQFTCPYGYRGAYLLADLDLLAQTIISARHFALISTVEAQRLLMLAGRSIRRALLSPIGYRFLGLTRIDVEQRNAKSRHALELMGAVPADILSSQTQASYAPR